MKQRPHAPKKASQKDHPALGALIAAKKFSELEALVCKSQELSREERYALGFAHLHQGREATALQMWWPLYNKLSPAHDADIALLAQALLCDQAWQEQTPIADEEQARVLLIAARRLFPGSLATHKLRCTLLQNAWDAERYSDCSRFNDASERDLYQLANAAKLRIVQAQKTGLDAGACLVVARGFAAFVCLKLEPASWQSGMVSLYRMAMELLKQKMDYQADFAAAIRGALLTLDQLAPTLKAEELMAEILRIEPLKRDPDQQQWLARVLRLGHADLQAKPYAILDASPADSKKEILNKLSLAMQSGKHLLADLRAAQNSLFDPAARVAHDFYGFIDLPTPERFAAVPKPKADILKSISYRSGAPVVSKSH